MTMKMMMMTQIEPYVMIEREPPSPTMTSDIPTHRSTNQNASTPDDVITTQRRYVGYIPDLLRALAALLDFRYELYPVPDGSYGYRKASREWSGLIGELVAEVTLSFPSVQQPPYFNASQYRILTMFTSEADLGLLAIFGLTGAPRFLACGGLFVTCCAI